MFAPLRAHLDACGISHACLDKAETTLLVVEDFGTRGLTGKTDARDNDNFRNFWRRHGRSGKGGASGGRWGLGKLVYSSSSEVRAFFGLTARAGDTGPLLMGQAVLRNHEIGSNHHPAHGFWFTDYGTTEHLQLPVTDAATIDEFRALTKVTRQVQPGLSIAVPYLKAQITETKLIEAVLRNYYFPILSGKLVVEVGNVLIDHQTFHAVAAQHAKTQTGQTIALAFVEQVSKALTQAPAIVAASAPGAKGIVDTMFSKDQMDEMKTTFREGKLLRVRLPVMLKRRNGGDCASYIDLFLHSLAEGEKPFALFARGSITVPGEARYFSGIQALGAMVASQKDIVEFLGDAENPAHTNWIASAEKLEERWASVGVVARIRHALRELHLLVAEQVARKDENALIDLFSLVDPSRSNKGPKKRSPKPAIDVVPKEKAISIKPRAGGFDLVAGPGAAKWTFPRKIRIRVAYDTMVGDPFNAHHRFDFDLTKGDIEIETTNADCQAQNEKVLIATVNGPDFVVSGLGFDTNRDLVIDARAA
ncbi:MAG: hypothetical protein DCF30_22345 [Hyphomicrobiales bacterium]|nr:MAG: hypothetical protein DCF30_22345 [Hyphomicrobiales bacterium]